MKTHKVEDPMSHKQAKAARRQVTASILITAYADGNLDVKGIPNNYDMGMKMMGSATNAVHGYFIQQALNGNMDKNGNVAAKLIQEPTEEQTNKVVKMGKK